MILQGKTKVKDTQSYIELQDAQDQRKDKTKHYKGLDNFGDFKTHRIKEKIKLNIVKG